MNFRATWQPMSPGHTYPVREQAANLTRYSNLAGTTLVGTSNMAYDVVGRPTNLQHKNSSGANIANYQNAFDLASRITSEILNNGPATNYSYDNTDQLTQDAVKPYTFDANGNRTMTGYATGPNNQILSDGTYNYYADKNGNIVQRTNIATGEVVAYTFDNRNRETGATRTTSAGIQMQAAYSFDALGQRVQAAVTIAGTTTTTRSAYDETRQIWADTDGTNALTMRYILGNSVLERLARISSAGTVAWLLQDRLGSIRNVVDSTGALIDTLAFDGFGNLVSESNPGNGGLYLWAGYRLDPETGFYRPDPTTERIYGPAIGRWWSVDSIWADDNPWRYVTNNPINLVDPSGQNPQLELITPPRDLLPGGKPGRKLTWKAIFDKKIPKGVTQFWIVTELEIWSIYAPGGKAPWIIHPGMQPIGGLCGGGIATVFRPNPLVETRYYADYDPIAGPLLDDDNVGFTTDYQVAFYFIRVKKTVGYGNGRKLGKSVPITKEQAAQDKKDMGVTLAGPFLADYFYFNQKLLNDSGIDLLRSMPKDVREAYDAAALRAKRGKIDLTTFSGAILNSAPNPVFSLPK